MVHAEAHRLLAAGYALEDLEPAERDAYKEHRDSCLPCRRLEAELDAVLADLALVAPDREPPATLLADVLRAVAPESVRHGRQFRRFPRPAAPTLAALGLAAAFGIVAVGIGARTNALQQQLEVAGTEIASLRAELGTDHAVLALAAAPDHVSAALHAEPIAPVATATILYRPGSTEAWLVAHGLPATPPGRVYQLWFADEAGVHALGTFAHDGDGPFVAPFGVDLQGSAAAMVTLEPEGGAVGEPGPQVVFGEI